MPVVLQGALKRGQKHTMESIEEEDENQIQMDKPKQQYGAKAPNDITNTSLVKISETQNS